MGDQDPIVGTLNISVVCDRATRDGDHGFDATHREPWPVMLSDLDPAIRAVVAAHLGITKVPGTEPTWRDRLEHRNV